MDYQQMRFEAAKAAMQAIGTWIPPADYGPFNWDSREDVCALKARWAVAQADALLSELAAKEVEGG